MNPQRLADIPPGEILASGIAMVVVAAIVGGLAGWAIDYLRTRRRRRAELEASRIEYIASRSMRIPLPAPATAPDRHRSVAAITRDADGQVIGVKYPATGTEARA